MAAPSPRWGRLTRAMSGYVDRGEVPGLIAAAWRHGDPIHLDCLGHVDDGGAAIAADALFRLGSMSKPIACVAALTLVEEGRLRLADPIARWLPEFATPKVLRSATGPLDEVVPPVRPLIVEDLFTHRAGFATSSLPLGPVGQAAQGLSAGISQRPDCDPDAWLARLAALPLLHQPGERVVNGFATDVLGILLARLTGQTVPELLVERVLGPLGMDETRFCVPARDLHRLPPAFSVGWLSGKRTVVDAAPESYWARPPLFPAAGAGLVGTAADYARFATMLANGGALGGERILARSTVRLMTSDFLTPEQRRVPFFGSDYWADRGFGLGVFVTDDPVRRRAPVLPGQYGWRGAFGTYWFNDPTTGTVALLMTQVAFPAVVPPIMADFETLVYQALDD